MSNDGYESESELTFQELHNFTTTSDTKKFLKKPL